MESPTEVVLSQQACFIGTNTAFGLTTRNSLSSDVENPILVADTLPPSLIPDLIEGKYVGIILGSESPFSHVANVLRMISVHEHSIQACVIGIGDVWTRIPHGVKCQIEPGRQSIVLDHVSLTFSKSGHFASDNIGVSTVKPQTLCYRPMYKYHPELAKLCIRGFEMLGKEILGNSCHVFVDNIGRIWVEGIGSPSQIARWALLHPREYIDYMVEYCRVLKVLLDLTESGHLSDESEAERNLTDPLSLHYMYSPLATLPVPHFAQMMTNKVDFGDEDFVRLTNYVASLSPIASKNISVGSALDITYYIARYIRDEFNDAIKVHEDHSPQLPYNWPIELKRDSSSDLLLVSMTISELRRGITSSLQAACPWYKSISRHR